MNAHVLALGGERLVARHPLLLHLEDFEIARDTVVPLAKVLMTVSVREPVCWRVQYLFHDSFVVSIASSHGRTVLGLLEMPIWTDLVSSSVVLMSGRLRCILEREELGCLLRLPILDTFWPSKAIFVVLSG